MLQLKDKNLSRDERMNLQISLEETKFAITDYKAQLRAANRQPRRRPIYTGASIKIAKGLWWRIGTRL